MNPWHMYSKDSSLFPIKSPVKHCICTLPHKILIFLHIIGTKSSDLKLRCRSIRFNKEEDSYIVSQESYGDPGLPHLTQSIALYGNSLDRSNIVINGFTLGMRQ